jgi:SAM-dependent methyltransferase
MRTVREHVRTHAPAIVNLVRSVKGRALPGTSRKERFTWIYETNQWADPTSVSGRGSARASTDRIVATLPSLIERLGVTSIVDAPCGDANWMPLVLDRVAHSVAYVGLDIVDELVARNVARFADRGWAFAVADIVTDPVPLADLVICRDCLVHLPDVDVRRVLANLAASGSTWLLTTSYERHRVNTDAVAGQWRTLDLRRPPFSLPEPVEMLDDASPIEPPELHDKRLMLWRLTDVADALANR